MSNVFGVRHGICGPCNACACRVKQKVVNLLTTETCDIHNAVAMFNASKEYLLSKEQDHGSCMHFLQTVAIYKSHCYLDPTLISGLHYLVPINCFV